MKRGIRAQLSIPIALIVLISVSLIGFLSNHFISLAFEDYVIKQQETKSQDIVANLSQQYNRLTGEWEIDYIHGVGMYALYDGYVVKLYDRNDKLVWDAENHDMGLCRQIMGEITDRMESRRPDVKGGFVEHSYDLNQNGQYIGRVSITAYGPYFLIENDVRFLDTLNLILAGIGISALIGSIIAGGLLARRIARPITKTAHIAKEIADGNLGIRFEGSAQTRELDELVAAINYMADSLENQENLRKRLTTDVAHELRTPLAAVASHIEAMVEGLWEPTRKRLQSCYEEINRISGLVADLERLAAVESDNLKLQKLPVDLQELACDVAGNLEMKRREKKIQLRVEGSACVVSADRDRITQVMTNLLSNAMKYTPENGHIRMVTEASDTSGIFSIEDDGIGIPKEDLPLIFERFYRADKSRNRKTGGAGIGLAIVKSIVTAHGGKVTAESVAGKGSKFTVVLPK